MSWSKVGAKASSSLVRQAVSDASYLNAVTQRHSLPRNLFNHQRRSRLLIPTQRLSISTSSVSKAAANSKSKSTTGSAAASEPKATPSVRVKDSRSSASSSGNAEGSSRTPEPETVLKVDGQAQSSRKEPQTSTEASQSSTSQQQQQQQDAPETQPQDGSQGQQTLNGMGPATREDLLKQRFFHAQEQNKRVYSGLTPPTNQAANLYPSFTTPSGDSVIPPEGAAGPSSNASSSASTSSGTAQQGTSSNTSSSDTSDAAQTTFAGTEHGDIEFDGRLHRPVSSQSLQSLEVPFDTHGFVKRLEAGGWISTAAKAQRLTPTAKSGKGKQAQSDAGAQELSLQLARRHDPAEAIMEGVRHLITHRGRQLAHACLNKSDVENQAYLFKAALSEIRTEVQVRGRNDAAGLRSITTLLQREVDALEQKMKEDIERLKHDIQVEMNNRKAESKEEQNNFEQEIQDLNNRFTISLSDLKTEIEQNIKWDATRRSLLLVFGIAAIVAANLAIADYLTRDDEAAKAAASKEGIPAGHPPASANAGPPASLGWATEGRILSVLPIMLIKPNSRMAATSRRIFRQLRGRFSGVLPAVATAGLFTASAAHRMRNHQSTVASSRAMPSRRPFGSSAVLANDQPAELRVPDSNVIVRLHSDGISIESEKLGLKPFRFDHVWLRDACQAPQSVHPSNRQKLFHTSDVPLDVDLLDPSHPPTIVSSEGEPALRLTFAKEHAVVNAFTAAFGEVKPADAAHVSEFPISYLLRHAIDTFYADTHMDIMSIPETWAAKDLTHFKTTPWTPSSRVPENAMEGALARPARIPWEAIRPGEDPDARTRALYALTEAVVRDGFAFVTRLPTDKTATEAGPDSARLRDLAETMGELRNTFYGLLWDVRSVANARNIAYTNLDLGLHMDLLYFQNPPRFQFLHMLRNKVRGGASIFVDSFKVAERMWEEDRQLWEVLTKVPVGFYYVNDGRHYRFTHPTFELAHDTEGHAGPPLAGTTMPRLSAVNYSPPFQSPLPLHPTKELQTREQRDLFYRALRRFSDLTLAEEFRYEKQMEEGECVIFDNRRVLHSRKGFEWDQGEGEKGEVKRWLKGCYVDGDAIWSTYRTLRTKVHGRAPLVPGGRRGVHTSAAPVGRQTRSFSTSSGKNGIAPTAASATQDLDPAGFAPLSDDPTVVDLHSLSGLRSREPSTTFSSYRPVPPLSTATLPKLYKQLSKSRLTFLVVLTGMAGYALCPASLTVAAASPVTTLLALTAGMTMCSAAANALNQLVEAPYDAQMPRTRQRPLPSRAVTPLHAFTFASASAISGVGLLATMVNPLTAALGAANVVLYSFTYTPMKRMSIANTWVGAVVGALPPLMGWAACTGTLTHATDLGGWSLAALLFAWQFPHFNSLAHTLRAEYARGGYRMMAVTNPALNRRVSLRYAVALLPICTLMMPLSGIVNPVSYALLSTPLNLLMAHAAWKFYSQKTVKAARWCFWVSLIHLPAAMLLAMGCKPEVWAAVYRFLGWEQEEEKQQEEKVV